MIKTSKETGSKHRRVVRDCHAMTRTVARKSIKLLTSTMGNFIEFSPILGIHIWIQGRKHFLQPQEHKYCHMLLCLSNSIHKNENSTKKDWESRPFSKESLETNLNLKIHISIDNNCYYQKFKVEHPYKCCQHKTLHILQSREGRPKWKKIKFKKKR